LENFAVALALTAAIGFLGSLSRSPIAHVVLPAAILAEWIGAALLHFQFGSLLMLATCILGYNLGAGGALAALYFLAPSLDAHAR
jgi:hypothetical protein